ncbi:hypothetical protein RIF29_08726 [Crotalaria pallida]|uniref:Uncharacterized protein n=1 Tax=Crotalaria pallida TaxID=3830 RepID=A0AAN9IJ47_CROPI
MSILTRAHCESRCDTSRQRPLDSGGSRSSPRLNDHTSSCRGGRFLAIKWDVWILPIHSTCLTRLLCVNRSLNTYFLCALFCLCFPLSLITLCASNVNAPKFDALKSVMPQREAFCFLVRIDRLWVVPGFINPDQAMAIEMVFLDQHVSLISFVLPLFFSCKVFCCVVVNYILIGFPNSPTAMKASSLIFSWQHPDVVHYPVACVAPSLSHFPLRHLSRSKGDKIEAYVIDIGITMNLVL